jgi:hypothetical protein
MHNIKAQTAMEYLLLSAIVAIVVFMAFARGGFMSRVHDTSEDYFNDVTRVIIGGPGNEPQQINGRWCDWSPCMRNPAGNIETPYQYRTCECPAPAFGGAQCPDTNQRPCT